MNKNEIAERRCKHCDQVISFQRGIPGQSIEEYWFSYATGSWCPPKGQYMHEPKRTKAGESFLQVFLFGSWCSTVMAGMCATGGLLEKHWVLALIVSVPSFFNLNAFVWYYGFRRN